jgi:hypothetical protein
VERVRGRDESAQVCHLTGQCQSKRSPAALAGRSESGVAAVAFEMRESPPKARGKALRIPPAETGRWGANPHPFTRSGAASDSPGRSAFRDESVDEGRSSMAFAGSVATWVMGLRTAPRNSPVLSNLGSLRQPLIASPSRFAGSAAPRRLKIARRCAAGGSLAGVPSGAVWAQSPFPFKSRALARLRPPP